MSERHEIHASRVCTTANVKRALIEAKAVGSLTIDQQQLARELVEAHPYRSDPPSRDDDYNTYEAVKRRLEEEADGELADFVMSNGPRGIINFSAPLW
jgi:hypothetical protein